MTKAERINSIINTAYSLSGVSEEDINSSQREEIFEANFSTRKEPIAKLYLEALDVQSHKVKSFYSDAEYGRKSMFKLWDYEERNRKYKRAKNESKRYLTEKKEETENSIYNEQTFKTLLEGIADLAIDFDKFLESKNKSKRLGIPAFIRGMIGLSCWLMLDTAMNISIYATGKALERFNCQKYVMNYIHKYTVEKGYPMFSKQDKLFNKWGIKIAYMYKRGNFYAPEVPFEYAGHKDKELGFIVREMVNSLDYEEYYDVFGGSGRSVLQFPVCENKKYFINDLNPCNCILWECLKDKKLYKELVNRLEEKQKELFEFLPKIANERKKINQLLHKLYNDIYDKYESDSKKSLGDITKDEYVDIAVNFVLVHNFLIQGRPADKPSSGTSLISTFKKHMCCWIFERDFYGMHNIYEKDCISIKNMTDYDIVVSSPNEPTTVLQLDPPYILTKGYKHSYNFNNLKNTMDILLSKDSERKFIFHHQTMYNKSASKKDKAVFVNFLKYWRNHCPKDDMDKSKEKLYVTFCVSTFKLDFKDELEESEIIEDCINCFIDLVVDGKIDEENYIGNIEDKGIYDEELTGRTQGEIIITNFYVDIDREHNIQKIMNPYAVRENTTSKNHDGYRIITMELRQYLDTLISRIEQKEEN